MSRSWKIAVSQKHKHRGERRGEGAGGADPGDVALLEKGLLSELPYCPHAPAPSGLTGRGADKGSSLPPQLPCPQKTIQDNRWHLPSYPTPRLEAHRFKQTTQDNGFKHIRPVLLCGSRRKPKVELLALQAFCYICNCIGLLFSCLPVCINGQCTVGPATLFSLQLSYVLFMPFVECPALSGH